MTLRNTFEENSQWNTFFAHVGGLGRNLSPDQAKVLADQIVEIRKLVASNISVEDILNWNPPK